MRTVYPEIITRELLARIDEVVVEFEYDIASIAFAYLEPTQPRGWRISGEPGGPVIEPGFVLNIRSRRRFVMHTIHFAKLSKETPESILDFLRQSIVKIRSHDDKQESVA